MKVINNDVDVDVDADDDEQIGIDALIESINNEFKNKLVLSSPVIVGEAEGEGEHQIGEGVVQQQQQQRKQQQQQQQQQQRTVIGEKEINIHKMFLKSFIPKQIKNDKKKLSKEILKININDRNAINEEIHGVKCLAINETPQLINDSLKEFDIQINKMKYIKEQEIIQYQQHHHQQQHQQGQAGHGYGQGSTTTAAPINLLRNVIEISPSYNNNQNQNQNQQQHWCYLNHVNTRLKFLRVEYFNVEKAVKRLINYLNFVYELWDYKIDCFIACRPIQISDFNYTIKNKDKKDNKNSKNNKNSSSSSSSSNSTEINSLLNPVFQYLPYRDQSGRRVCVTLGIGTNDPNTYVKSILYMHWVASEDIETQQKGIVVIIWPLKTKTNTNTNNSNSNNNNNNANDNNNNNSSKVYDDNSSSSSSSSWSLTLSSKSSKSSLAYKTNIDRYSSYSHPRKCEESQPVRVCCNHFCILNDDPFSKAFFNFFLFGMGLSTIGLKYKASYGSTTEILYQLQSYGIYVQSFPLTFTGSIKTTNHRQWMAVRKKIEYQQEQERKRAQNIDNQNISFRPIINDYNQDMYNIVECPRSYDVLFRKGGSSFTQNHPGNLFFHNLIESTHDEHFKFGIKDKKQKVEMTWYIISQIENQKINNNDYNCNQARFLDWSSKEKCWFNITDDRKLIRSKVAATYTKYKYKKPTMISISKSKSIPISLTNNRNILNSAGEKITSSSSSSSSNSNKSSFWDIACDDCIGTSNNHDMVW